MKVVPVLTLAFATAMFAPQQAAPAASQAAGPAKEQNAAEMVEGTLARGQLQTDIKRMIQMMEASDHPNCKFQVVKQWRSANSPGVERWEVKSCDATSSYDVRMIPSPKGGTDFQVRKRELEQKEKTDTPRAGQNSAAQEEEKLAPRERIQRWAERAEAAEAGQTIDVPPPELLAGIQRATNELKEYLAVHPDDAGALLLLARLGRAEIMASPIVIQDAQDMKRIEAKRRERVDQLAVYCDHALALDPNKAEAYYWKARLYGIRHFGVRDNEAAWVYVDVTLAAQFARRAVELDPQKVEYREALAQYLVLNKQSDEAMNVMREIAGGKHSIYLLLMDQKALPLPPGAALLEQRTEERVQQSIEGGWKMDFIPLRMHVYVVPLSAADMETHFRKIWSKFQFFEFQSERKDGGKVTSYMQFFRWKGGALEPAEKKSEVPSSCDDAREGMVFSLAEFRDTKGHVPFPVPVGNVFGIFSLRNCRPAMERLPQTKPTASEQRPLAPPPTPATGEIASTSSLSSSPKVKTGEINEKQQPKRGRPPVTDEALLSLSFATPQSGWAVGTNSVILHTADGGQNWNILDIAAHPKLFSVAFATPQSGWMVGRAGTILHTADGGQTWTKQTSGTDNELYFVSFATPQSGWAVGRNGAIVHTEDSGLTWKAQTSGTDNALYSVAFVTPQSGWAVGEKGAIVHTGDGGQTWKTQNSSTSELLNSVAFATPQSGWAVGEKGAIVHTGDGGQTWKAQNSGTDKALYSVALATPQLGWAVGDKGAIVHTEDGGQTWKAQTSGSNVWLNSVALATPQSVWVVGDICTIIHTEDLGQTWAKVFDAPTSLASNPKVKNGEINEKQRYKSDQGRFSITVPAAGNPLVRTYKLHEAQLKYEDFDYEEVVFHIDDFGEAYGAGVRRIPQSVLEQMAKEEPKQTLSNLSKKALFQWRDNYAEEPQPVDQAQVQTQFGEGLLRIYVAKRSSLLGRMTGKDPAGKPKLEPSDARIAVLVVKKGDLFIYATAEDEYMQRTGPEAPLDPKLDLRKALQSFFATMTVKI